MRLFPVILLLWNLPDWRFPEKSFPYSVVKDPATVVDFLAYAAGNLPAPPLLPFNSLPVY
jgi:hypothetical protein